MLHCIRAAANELAAEYDQILKRVKQLQLQSIKTMQCGWSDDSLLSIPETCLPGGGTSYQRVTGREKKHKAAPHLC